MFTFFIMKKTLFFIAFFFFITARVFAQSNIELLETALENYAAVYPWEKVYIHTDKPHYFLNDTIWFKAYGTLEVDSEKIYPTLSVPLYVDLIDSRFDRNIERSIVKMEDGKGMGDIVLPRNLEPGIYTLRAYTNWMNNFGNKAYFTKDIYVGEVGDGWNLPDFDAQLHIGFFPEGGNLIAGTENLLGFKSSDEFGKGVDVSGVILNSKGEAIQQFESDYLGMGKVKFLPKKGENYEVLISPKNKPSKKFELGRMVEEGYLLHIDALSDEKNLDIKIFQNTSKPPKELHLIAMRKGGIAWNDQINLSDNESNFSIPKDTFQAGLHKFSLMDEETRILAERLVFLFPQQAGKILFQTDKDTYNPKENVQLEIHVQDASGMGIEGDFSISVLDGDQVFYPENTQNIFTYFLLDSEVQGEVENPAYYFDPNQENAEKHLDNLLLTQGWRRFNWSDLAKLQSLPNFVIEPGLSVSGKVDSGGESEISEPQMLTLMVRHPFEDPDFYDGVTDSLGVFSFTGLDFKDSVTVFVQAIQVKKKKKRSREVKENEINILPPRIPFIGERKYTNFSPNQAFRDENEYLITVRETKNLMDQFKTNREIELGEVTIVGRKSQIIPDKRTIQYQDRPDAKLELTEEFYYFSNIFQLLRGRFPGVDVRGDVISLNPFPVVLIRGGRISGAGLEGATFLLNGAPVQPETLAALPVPEIERIDVLRGLSKAAVFGSFGGGGIIHILTKSGNPNPDFSDEKSKGNAVAEVLGFSPVRKFYEPPVIPDINAPFAVDYRSTIYWNPKIETGREGKTKINFRLTESSPLVRVILEGLSKDGEPIFGMYNFHVGTRESDQIQN
jgi:hypothetical protein